MNEAIHQRVRQFIFLIVISAVSFLAPNLALAQSVGDTAIFTDFTTFDTVTIKAVDLKDRPVLLYFWAGWCPTCNREMPTLTKIYAKYRAKGFEVLAVNFREEPANALVFFKRHGFAFPGGMIDAAYAANYPNLRGTPTWFLVDRQGVIRKKVIGNEDILWELEKALVPLL